VGLAGRVDQPPAHHRRPSPVGDVPGEGQEAPEVPLLVIIDEDVIVTLGASEVDAEEQAADVGGQAGVVDRVLAVMVQPLRQEEGGPAIGLILGVGAEDLAGDPIPGLVGRERVAEIARPGRMFSEPLHEHDVEPLRHPVGIIRARQQGRPDGRPRPTATDRGPAFDRPARCPAIVHRHRPSCQPGPVVSIDRPGSLGGRGRAGVHGGAPSDRPAGRPPRPDRPVSESPRSSRARSAIAIRLRTTSG